MNNIIDLNVDHNNVALRERGYGDADFDVEYQPLYTSPRNEFSNYNLVPNKIASVRVDTQNVLGIHSKNSWQGVNFKDGIDRCRDIIINSGLADESIIEMIGVTSNSKQCIVTYILPNVLVNTPDGDQAQLMIVMVNSFNGVWAFSIRIGLRLMACFNGLISNTNGLIYKSRHNRNLNLDHAVSVITKSLPILYKETDLWREWLNTKCSDQDVLKIIGVAADNNILISQTSYLTIPDVILNADGVRRSKNVSHLWRAWTEYKHSLGANMWAMYNALTDWSTHIESKKSSIISIKNRRENVVRKIIADPALFLQKVAA